jgi:predicted secreted hydrolase
VIAAIWAGSRALTAPAPPAAEARLVVDPAPVPSGFARADGPRQFSFPLDHGAHPDFQTEWWYYTGNLFTPQGRHFGYQLTFFRRAFLPPGEPLRESGWAANQVYFAHFALTDTSAARFRFFERFERGAAGLAGAQGLPLFKVWLGDWQVAQVGAERYQLSAQEGDLRLNLELIDRKGPVLQGLDGYSQKGSQPGNASYYISQTRLDSRGVVEVGGQRFEVAGASWKDHEFSTSALAPGQVGWDWFALQMNDGSELMAYRIRSQDGSPDAYAHGMLVLPDGATRRLKAADFRLTPVGSWQSPQSGAVYPAEWRLEIPSENLTLRIKPRLPDQELRVLFTYWEGAVVVSGERNGKALEGVGYVEMTGYAQSMQGQF